MRKRIASVLSSLIPAFYCAVSLLIVLLVLLRGFFDYAKLTLPLPDWLLLLASALAALGGTALIRRFRGDLGKRFGAFPPSLFFFLLFLLQIYISYNCYFQTGWDANAIIICAKTLADGSPIIDSWAIWYFQRWENNVLLTALYSLFIRIYRYVGILDVEQNPYMALITVQCALSSLTGYLVHRCSLRLWKRRSAAWAVSLLFCGLVGLSPWMMIPYTDPMGLIVPMLVLALYFSMENRRRLPLKWAAMGLLAYWGFRLKPQCLICVIAIVLLEALELFREDRFLAALRRRAGSILAFIAVVCVSSQLFTMLLPAMGLSRNKELAFGPAHYFMMGLNDETDGSYCTADANFSDSFAEAGERSRQDMARAFQRIADYGPAGLLGHLAKKTLVNFSDGTFNWGSDWGCDGKLFFRDLTEPKNRFVSPMLRELYYLDGAFFPLFTSYMQALWLLVLAAPLGLLADREARKSKTLRMLMLSILGLTLFETLFEASARYLYSYSPYFILLAAAGWKSLLARLHTLRRKA